MLLTLRQTVGLPLPERLAELGMFVAAGAALCGLAGLLLAVLHGLWLAALQPPPLGATAFMVGLCVLWAGPTGIGLALFLHQSSERLRRWGTAALDAADAVPNVVVAVLALGLLGAGWPQAVGVLCMLALPTVALHAGRALAEVHAHNLEAAVALGIPRSLASLGVVAPLAWRGLLRATLLGGLRALGDAVILALLWPGSGVLGPEVLVQPSSGALGVLGAVALVVHLVAWRLR